MNRSFALIMLAVLICGCIGAPPQAPVNETAQPPSEPQQPAQSAVDPYELMTTPLNSLRDSAEILVNSLNNYYSLAGDSSVYTYGRRIYNETINMTLVQQDYNAAITRGIDRISASLDSMNDSLKLVYGVPIEVINLISRSIEQMRIDLQQVKKDISIDLTQYVEKFPIIDEAVRVLQRDITSLSSAVEQLKKTA
jgi:hypothetical protein